MKNYLILFLLATVLFSSCSDQYPENSSPDKNKANKGIDFTESEKAVLASVLNDYHTISLDEAQKTAQDAMDFLISQNPSSLKSLQAKAKIMEIQVIEKQNTNLKIASDNDIDITLPDTIAYIFNFENNNGYAMIAADDRIDQSVLACSDLGNIPKEVIDNEALGFFLDNAAEYIVNQLETAQAKQDSILDEVTTKLEKTLPKEYLGNDEDDSDNNLKGLFRKKKKYTVTVTNNPAGDWEITNSKGYYIPVEWGQSEPYSNNVKNKKSCGTVKTGCVATAAAQIMAYWKYPCSIDGVTFDWNGLVRNKKIDNDLEEDWALALRSDVAHLMERIGANTEMNYGCSSSGTKTYKARDYMRRLGYVGGGESKYNTGIVQSSLDAGCPLLAKGDRTFKYIKIFGKKIGYTKNGHAWIIDGYVKKRRLMKQTVVTRNRKSGQIISQNTNYYYEFTSFIHNNWGWEGLYNGWFGDGCFDSRKGDVPDPRFTKANTDDDFDAGSDGNYKYNNKIYSFLKPKNR